MVATLCVNWEQPMICLYFFDCLQTYVASKDEQNDWSLLTDRLYRRYLKLDELELACNLMSKAKDAFEKLPSSSIAWSKDFHQSNPNSKLNPSLTTLYDIFAKYFECFFYCVESAKINNVMFKDAPNYKYEPVKIGVMNIPYHIVDMKRSLYDYDNLQGAPFWMETTL
jgi:hypothetical protein